MACRILADSGLSFYGDECGDIPAGSTLGYGLYFQDIRFLSAMSLEIAGMPTVPLSSSAEGGSHQSLLLANQCFTSAGRDVPGESISVHRERFVDGAFHERIVLTSHNRFDVTLDLSLTLASDYRDVRDIRGLAKADRGQVLEPTLPRQASEREDDPSAVSLRYRGSDGLTRRTDILLEATPTAREVVAIPPSGPGPAALLDRLPRLLPLPVESPAPVPGVRLRFRLSLAPARPLAIGYSLHPSVERQALPRLRVNFDLAAARVRREYEERWAGSCTSIATEHPALNRLLQRCVLDIRSLLIRQSGGLLLTAGLPWYPDPIARVSLIASGQVLAMNPEIAVRTLRFLADLQGAEDDQRTDEEPGKIPQRVRIGNSAWAGRGSSAVSFAAADPTPLFVSLFCRTMDWLGDDNLFEELRPAALRAVDWVDRYGDRDGDGLVEAVARFPDGPGYPVWRSSPDAYLSRDGTPAESPLAPVELQAYVFDAKSRLSRLLRAAGDVALSDRLGRDADRLRERIHTLYWMPDEVYYAAALDGRKSQMPLITSASGHLLWADAVSSERAASIVRRLVSEDLFSGWGVRTVSSLASSYNPMSYHNGSVWPHDHSLIVSGLRRFGYDDPATRLGEALIEAMLRLGEESVPEAICGFARDRRANAGPARYSLACSPSAWAAGAVFELVAGFLGLAPDAANRRLGLRPRIPSWLGRITVRNLRVGRATIDFAAGPDGVRVLGRRGELDVFSH